MNIRVKKFKLRYAGETFGTGTVLDIPDTEAKALIQNDPDCYEIVPDTPEMAQIKANILVKDNETGEEGFNLDGMTVAQLKDFAKENGIDIGDATKKQDIVAAIMAAAEPDESEGLPPIDAASTVK